MVMGEGREANDMLEPVLEAQKPLSEFGKASIRIDMANDPGEGTFFVVLLDFSELLLEPLYVVAGVKAILGEHPVPRVACLGVEGEDCALGFNGLVLFVVEQDQGLGVVTPAMERGKGISLKPVGLVPLGGQCINDRVLPLLREIMHVDGVHIMVAHKRVERKRSVSSEVLFHQVGNLGSVLNSLVEGELVRLQRVVRGVVTCPQDGSSV